MQSYLLWPRVAWIFALAQYRGLHPSLGLSVRDNLYLLTGERSPRYPHFARLDRDRVIFENKVRESP